MSPCDEASLSGLRARNCEVPVNRGAIMILTAQARKAAKPDRCRNTKAGPPRQSPSVVPGQLTDPARRGVRPEGHANVILCKTLDERQDF